MSHALIYPDISDILAAKAKGRIALASLSFAEKIAILDQLKQASDEIRGLRRPANVRNI